MKDRTPVARQLRRQQTLAERKMWWLLRSRALCGFKFHRQYAIGPYFADFCCRTANLIVELDGSQHIDAQEYDEERTRYLEAGGYKVIRFWNNEVISQEKVVLQTILSALSPSPEKHPPSP
jgi:very-short-patch-repair endonuclease